ncbi:MAG: hypothetical protein IKF07_06325 [Eubacterium sp.]|nr:hypothetical protein [Eubacterium sp.]
MTVYVDGKGFQTIPVDIDAYLEELKMEVLFKDPCKYGHMLALKETVPATFDADGSTEYWYCDKCGRAYDVVDWWHQKEIALEDTVIKKIGTVSLDKTSYTYNGSVQKSLH